MEASLWHSGPLGKPDSTERLILSNLVAKTRAYALFLALKCRSLF
jgi:hypothetical protein